MSTSQPQGNNGFDSLINVHTRALEENSREIAEMLKELSTKSLSRSDIKSINLIKRELKRIDKEIDNLGD